MLDSIFMALFARQCSEHWTQHQPQYYWTNACFPCGQTESSGWYMFRVNRFPAGPAVAGEFFSSQCEYVKQVLLSRCDKAGGGGTWGVKGSSSVWSQVLHLSRFMYLTPFLACKCHFRLEISEHEHFSSIKTQCEHSGFKTRPVV